MPLIRTNSPETYSARQLGDEGLNVFGCRTASCWRGRRFSQGYGTEIETRTRETGMVLPSKVIDERQMQYVPQHLTVLHCWTLEVSVLPTLSTEQYHFPSDDMCLVLRQR